MNIIYFFIFLSHILSNPAQSTGSSRRENRCMCPGFSRAWKEENCGAIIQVAISCWYTYVLAPAWVGELVIVS